jgi:UDP-GlcNAc:undecaprenyl-phosphate/decaprenyl-phosphate GlcNAc-1-phosphate transferase
MPSEESAAAALIVGAGVSAAAAPLMIRIAHQAGILDHPGGYKRHSRPTPCLGGFAILVAVLVASFATAGIAEPIPIIAGGAAVICLLGTADDRRALPPVLRLTVQAGLGVSLWAAGVGWDAGLPDSAELVLTVFWIVVAVNVFNLIDNLDGAALGAAAGSAVGVVAIALILGAEAWAALAALALLGACLALLPFNLAKPARIFLGDGGSTLLGFLIAISAMGALRDESAALSATMALLLGIPLLDTAFVMFSRRRRGIALLTGGRDHLTHRVLAWAGSPWKVAAIVAGAQTALSALAAGAVELSSTAVLLAGVLYGLTAVVVIAIAGVERGESPSELSAFPGEPSRVGS